MPPDPNPRFGPSGQGILFMVAGVVLFTLLDAIAKDLTGRYPAAQIIWARITLQLIFVVLILRRAVAVHIRTAMPLFQISRGVTQLGAGLLFFLALSKMGLAEATALGDINPVLVTIGAAVFLGERIGPRRIAAVVVALCGALIIIRPGSDVFGLAALLPLASALAYAVNVLLTRAVGRAEGVWTAMLWTSIVATLIASAVLPFVYVPVAGGDVWRFLAVGALGTAAQLCVIRALTVADASVTAPFSYLGIALASVWGYVFFGDLPDRWTVVGALVIAGSGLYVWHRETRGRR